VVLQIILFVLIGALGANNLPNARAASGGLLVIGLGVLVGLAGAWVVRQGIGGLGRTFTAMPRPREDGSLVREGIYARIRHPIYAGSIGLGLGWSMITLSPPALAATLALVIVLDLKARLEETWLTVQYPEYAAYRQRTHRFIPGLY
jgi:protein-S-isoprenylcysteine O-methyltransferase Ste14